MAVFGLLLVMCTPFGTAIPLSSFYSYGSAAGDSKLPTTDDGSSGAISLPSPFLFFGASCTSLYVSFKVAEGKFAYTHVFGASYTTRYVRFGVPFAAFLSQNAQVFI